MSTSRYTDPSWSIDAVWVCCIFNLLSSLVLLSVIASENASDLSILLPESITLLMASNDIVLLCTSLITTWKFRSLKSYNHWYKVASRVFLLLLTTFLLIRLLLIINTLGFVSDARAQSKAGISSNDPFDLDMYKYISRIGTSQWIRVQNTLRCCGYKSNDVTVDPFATGGFCLGTPAAACRPQLKVEARRQGRTVAATLLLTSFPILIAVASILELSKAKFLPQQHRE